jgi:hypothetical protein
MRKKKLLKVIKKAEALSFSDAASGSYKDADMCYLMFYYLRKAMEE